MSTGPLPRTLDFRRAATREARVSGSLRPGDLPRLAPLLAGTDGTIEVSIDFHRDEEGRFLASLAVDAVLPVECQRCLEAVSQTLAPRSELAAVWSDDQARHLPASLEPVLAGEEEVDLWELVEEELVLALPPFSYHDDPACIDRLAPGGVQQEVLAEAPARDNPFEVLAQLKRDQDSGE